MQHMQPCTGEACAISFTFNSRNFTETIIVSSFQCVWEQMQSSANASEADIRPNVKSKRPRRPRSIIKFSLLVCWSLKAKFSVAGASRILHVRNHLSLNIHTLSHEFPHHSKKKERGDVLSWNSQSSRTRRAGQEAATCERRPATRHLKAAHELHGSLSEPLKLPLFTASVCGRRGVVHRPPVTDGAGRNEKHCTQRLGWG